ncbi:MAG: hypothetical protein ACRBBP_09455 [Bdellovibrionales bacterium]
MEKLKHETKLETSLVDEQYEDLGASLSGSFMNLSYKGGARAYYSQFGKDVQERFVVGSDGKVCARFTAFTRELYQKDQGTVKVLFVANVRTANTREALVGWSEKLLPEILKLKKDLVCDHSLFFLSRRERGLFNFFIRPRKKRDDQIRFSHLRGVEVQIVQGQKFFPEKPLEHIEIRRAKESDLEKLSGYIKQASKYAPLSRHLREGEVLQEFKSVKNFSPEDLALAFDGNGEIVGSLGAINMNSHADIKFKFNDLLEPTFNVLQGYLRSASWITDLRPVSEETPQSVIFFTHMYFNNHDIFYSLICWWIKQTKLVTKKERPVFLYPFYKGDLKAAPPESLFVSGFKGDLYLMQDTGELPSDLLKPVLFSESLDIDLPYLI